MALQEDIRKRALERFSANEAVDFEELTDIATANGIKPVHPIMTGMFAKMRRSEERR